MDSKIIYIIIGMSLVTYLPRVIPLVVLSKIKVPSLVLKWLKYVPVAVLSALLAPGILISDQQLSVNWNNQALLASIPCLFVAAKTKNLFLTVVTGVVSMLIMKMI